MRVPPALLAVVLTFGCTKKPDNGPACPEVVDHMVIVMKAGLKGHESVNLGDRQQMITQCEQRKMSPSVRRCLFAAQNLEALASCRPATGAPPPNAGPPQPLPTRPLPTGGAAPAGDSAAGSAAGSQAGSGS